MNYIYRVISFLVLVVLFIGCGSQDKNNENKPKANSKEYSSSQSCFADTRSIFKNINAPVFTSASSVDIYEGKKNVFTIVATSGGSITYSICGRGSEFFNIESDGKITFKDGKISNASTRPSYKIIVKATDSGKSTSQTFTINILGTIKPNIENIGAKSFTLNSAITPIEFVNTGGTIASCSVTPSLPTGLMVGLSSTTENCALSGTPTVSSSSAEYNITASNGSGDDNATINITTSQLAPVISDTTLSKIFPTQSVGSTYINGFLSESWIFTNTGGAITKCELNTTIAGLTVGEDCTINGTPTSEVLGSYTIKGWNSDNVKSNDLLIYIHVKQNNIGIIDVSGNPELIVGQAMTPIQFDPQILYCAISPELPLGLTLLVNKTEKTCKITGTPTNAKDSTIYTVTAMNAFSGGSATVTIAVNTPLLAPNIANAIDQTFTSETTITDLNFTNTGGAIASCDINKSLSTGLSFNTTTCEITGTPTGGAVNEIIYTITAKNTAGENNATVKITVNAGLSAPDIANQTNKTFAANTKNISIPFTNSGGAITSCTISPSLPTGLSINNTTCDINGTSPSEQIAQVEHTITATNTAGSNTATIKIDIRVSIGQLKTSQTTSHVANDDGAYKKGITRSYTRANEIVTDNITKLQWQDNDEAKTITKNHSEAIAYCQALTLNSLTDWELPTIKELLSIVDHSKSSPSINATFVNTAVSATDPYWSATSVSSDSGAWFVDFIVGYILKNNKTKENYVRCVRARQ